MTGSLQEKNGFWYTVIAYKDAEDKWRYKWESTKLPIKGNKKKAEAILKERLRDCEQMNEAYIGKDQLFADFLKGWLKIVKVKLQRTTYDNYVHVIYNHISPYFESRNLYIHEIMPYHIQKYYHQKLDEGLSPNTVLKHHSVIRTALQFAVKNGMISKNAADFADKPSKKKSEAKYYTIDELNKLIAVMKGTPIEVPVMLALHWGLRRSEVLGLKWSNMDFDTRTVNICSKVVRVYNDDTGKVVAVCDDTMKTESSRRKLPISDELYDYLMLVRERRDEYHRLFGQDYYTKDLDFVCVDKEGRRLAPDFVSNKFRKIIRDNGLKPMNFHGLRHSCATLLLSLDFDIRYIQEYLGHSSYQITAQTYAHVNFDNKRKMNDKISDALK